MKAYKCDRCRKLFEGYDYQRTHHFSITDHSSTCGRSLNLCPNCNAEVQESKLKGGLRMVNAKMKVGLEVMETDSEDKDE